MSNIDEMIKVRNKFEETQRKYGLSSQKQLINELNKIYETPNSSYKADKVHQRAFTQLKNAINNKHQFCRHASILDVALDKYIQINSESLPSVTVNPRNVYHYIADQLNQDIQQPNAHFWNYSHYFIIRRAYSAKDSVIISVMKIQRDDNNILRFSNFRRSITLKTNLLSEGFVFDISPSTVNITGMVKSIDGGSTEVLMENIHLNKTASNADIFNGIYLGCCYKNTAYTPFSTRVCFIPINISTLSTEDLSELEHFSSCPSIERFIKKYNEATSPNFDDYEENQQRYKHRAEAKLLEIVGNKKVDDTDKEALSEELYEHAVHQNKGYYFLKLMLENFNISIYDLAYERIVNIIDDEDPFGGLREYRIGV